MARLYSTGLMKQSWCPLLACCLAASSCEVLAEGLGRGCRVATGTLQLHVAAGAMCDGAKHGQMCLLGAKITPDPFAVTSFSPNCPPIFTTPRAAQDKLVKMGPCRFGWVLGVTQFLQVLIKMGKRSEQGCAPQDGKGCPEGHGEAK